MRLSPVIFVALAACEGEGMLRHPMPDAPPIGPTANPARDIRETKLQVDVTQLAGTATIAFAPGMAGASLEVGDLQISSVTRDGEDVPFAITGKQLDLGLPANDAQTMTVEIKYSYKLHENFDGLSMRGFTFTWPYFCGDLFPCHSAPSDGTLFSLDVQGVPAGKTAIYAPTIANDAPSYMLAWSIDDYVETPLGTTTAGTELSVWHRASEATTAMNGTQNLVAAFDWLEKTIGPYRFGTKAGTVSVAWPAGAYGGMEHHPRWHVDDNSLGSQETNVHEAAHGWFGDGIRIQCWEDFVLSEGTVTYLAGRALDVVAPTVGAQTWTSYANELGGIPPADPVWPQSCGTIDILNDNLYTNAPYIRGAFFYRAVADRVGAAKLDEALAAFYQAHAGGSATMQDMLDTIKTVTGYDPTTCAQMWLRSTVRPTPAACP
ncbi:MAG TPA: M1 family aminopeptidase [Kofleriaceae bacterium]|nr:M1 family aminopeptidase [Kofleriaceae bacterium]